MNAIERSHWEAEQKNIATAERQAETPAQITTAKKFIQTAYYQTILRIFNDNGNLIIFYRTKFSRFAPEAYGILPDGTGYYILQ